MSLTKEKYDALKYPLYRHIHTSDMIRKDLHDLANYKATILDENSIKNHFGKHNNIIPINNMKIVFVTDYFKELKLVFITDYFSQKCRIKCCHMKNISPLEYFTKNKTIIYNDIMRMYGKINYDLLDIYLYKNIKQCTNFYTPLVMNILNYFKPNSWLDFSAGWGDRLIGAIAYGMNNINFTYTGIDPSRCMKKRYAKIIRKLANNDSRYRIINLPFEDTNINETFDLVMTSPPFFDLEIYENEPEQSLVRYNTVDAWFDKFMKPSINMSIEKLNKNGHLALYIADSMNGKYVEKTNNYINSKTQVKYIGNLYWFNKSSSKRLRIIYVWKRL